MANCTGCSQVMQNLGFPQLSLEDFGAIQGMMIFPKYHEDGVTRNFLPVSSILNQATYETFLYASDPYNRVATILGIKEGVITVPEPVYEDIEGDRRKVGTNARQFSAKLWKESFTWLGKFNDLGCTELSVIFIDDCYRLLGLETANAGQLYGFDINVETIVADYNYTVRNSSNGFISMSFDLEKENNYSDYFVVPCDFITADIKNTRSMLDLDLTEVSSSTTEIVINAKLQYKNAKTIIPYTGVVTAFEVVQGGSVVASTNTIDTDTGNITLTGTFATGSTIVRANLYSAGFDVHSVTFTIS